jgi:outer membrane protein OmpA-like peptidoglycan-associated protein
MPKYQNMRSIIAVIILVVNYNVLFAQNLLKDKELMRSCTFYFDTDSIQPKAGVDSLLRIEKATLFRQKNLILQVSGFTDDKGPIAYNEKLAEGRAASIVTLYEELGLGLDTIIVKIYGEKNPLVKNSNEESRQLNRRVKVEVFKERELALIKRQVNFNEEENNSITEVRMQTSYKNDNLLTDSLGYFQFYAPIGEHVSLFYLKKDYFFGGEEIQVTAADTVKEEMLLQKLQEGLKGDVNELNFVGNEAIILEYHKGRLNDLVDFLKINESVEIHIGGHVNQPGKVRSESSSHGKLAHRRALLVYGELIKSGIDPERMTYKGYSNRFMKFPNPKNWIENRRNRRVEITITALDYKAKER